MSGMWLSCVSWQRPAASYTHNMVSWLIKYQSYHRWPSKAKHLWFSKTVACTLELYGGCSLANRMLRTSDQIHLSKPNYSYNHALLSKAWREQKFGRLSYADMLVLCVKGCWMLDIVDFLSSPNISNNPPCWTYIRLSAIKQSHIMIKVIAQPHSQHAKWVILRSQRYAFAVSRVHIITTHLWRDVDVDSFGENQISRCTYLWYSVHTFGSSPDTLHQATFASGPARICAESLIGFRHHMISSFCCGHTPDYYDTIF